MKKVIRNMFNKVGHAKIFSGTLSFLVVLLLVVSVYGVFGGESLVECSDFVETADGFYFCVDDEKVYECSSVDAKALNEECENAVDHGALSIDSFFGSYHIPDGKDLAEAYHRIKPKNVFDFPIYLTYEVIVKKGDGVKSFRLEKKSFQDIPIYGTKEVCVWN